MKTKEYIISLALLAGPFVGAFLFNEFRTVPQASAQPKLEEILSIKQLHLVKHTYNDLFFLPPSKKSFHKTMESLQKRLPSF